MRCISYCTANVYDLHELEARFSPGAPRQRFKDCLFIELLENPDHPIDLFLFSYGVIVCWGSNSDFDEWLLQQIKDYEREPLSVRTEDEFSFQIGDSPRIFRDEITVPDNDPMSRLAMSHGIAQSVKLAVFEQTIETVIEETRYLPLELATKGKIPLSRQQIRCMMGRLFIERCSVNLHTEILDIPEFFWDYPELEHLYRMMSKYLDLFPRVEVLNKRLDIVHELFDILTEELRHQHSSTLEWVIIFLILGELVVQILWH